MIDPFCAVAASTNLIKQKLKSVFSIHAQVPQ